MVFKPLFLGLTFEISKNYLNDMVYLKSRDAEDAFKLVGAELGYVYNLLFTKMHVHHSKTKLSLSLRVSCFLFAVSLLIAFTATMGKSEYPKAMIWFPNLGNNKLLKLYSKVVASRSTARRDVDQWRRKLVTVFLGNIHPIGDEGNLRALMMKYGRVVDFYIPLHRRNPRRNKFGFFRFKDLREALSVIRALDGFRWNGWRLNMNLAKYGWEIRNNDKQQDIYFDRNQNLQQAQKQRAKVQRVAAHHPTSLMFKKPTYAEVVGNSYTKMNKKATRDSEEARKGKETVQDAVEVEPNMDNREGLDFLWNPGVKMMNKANSVSSSSSSSFNATSKRLSEGFECFSKKDMQPAANTHSQFTAEENGGAHPLRVENTANIESSGCHNSNSNQPFSQGHLEAVGLFINKDNRGLLLEKEKSWTDEMLRAKGNGFSSDAVADDTTEIGLNYEEMTKLNSGPTQLGLSCGFQDTNEAVCETEDGSLILEEIGVNKNRTDFEPATITQNELSSENSIPRSTILGTSKKGKKKQKSKKRENRTKKKEAFKLKTLDGANSPDENEGNPQKTSRMKAEKTMEIGRLLDLISDNEVEAIDRLMEFEREERTKTGGLICMWSKEDFHLSSIIIKERYNWLRGKFPKVSFYVNLINVSASNDVKDRKEFLDELAGLKTNDNDLWCFAGDFNAVLCDDERVGASVQAKSISDFANFTQSTTLVDLPLVGRKFTWHQRGGGSMSRLDCFLLSANWLSTYSSINQWSLVSSSISDHVAICLGIDVLDWGPKPFKLFNHWLDNSDFNSLVEEEWKSYEVRGYAGFRLLQKMKMLKNDIRLWNGYHKGGIVADINSLDKEIDNLESEYEDCPNNEEIGSLIAEKNKDLWHLQSIEERTLSQKARQKWI
ncbi:hypothetical protein PTKIN_Ptkin02bG0222200 [Pterospermum kingtungense]